MKAPLDVSFAAGSDHLHQLPVIWRDDRQVGWYPIAVGDAGGTATASRKQFSPHIPGWSDVTGWIGDTASAAKRG